MCSGCRTSVSLSGFHYGSVELALIFAVSYFCLWSVGEEFYSTVVILRLRVSFAYTRMPLGPHKKTMNSEAVYS